MKEEAIKAGQSKLAESQIDSENPKEKKSFMKIVNALIKDPKGYM